MLVKVDPETAEPDQGDTESRPNPAPRASNARETAAATKAPAIMLAQETPDTASVQTNPIRANGSVHDSPPKVEFILLCRPKTPSMVKVPPRAPSIVNSFAGRNLHVELIQGELVAVRDAPLPIVRLE
jgi:hypothetical protein